jgi:hypothetical protein
MTKTKKLKESHKRAIRRVIDQVLTTWTMPEKSTNLLPLWLAAPHPFYTNIFCGKLADEVNKDLNGGRLNGDAIALDLVLQVRHHLF